jgi:hypothetical protein
MVTYVIGLGIPTHVTIQHSTCWNNRQNVARINDCGLVTSQSNSDSASSCTQLAPKSSNSQYYKVVRLHPTTAGIAARAYGGRGNQGEILRNN